jgi:hypothetical protein
VKPYDLRHSWVSLLIANGASVVEVARQAGHAPTMTLDTYAHLFDELQGEPDGAATTRADHFINLARTQESVREVSVLCPRPEAPADKRAENPCKSGEEEEEEEEERSRRPDSNRGPLHYE